MGSIEWRPKDFVQKLLLHVLQWKRLPPTADLVATPLLTQPGAPVGIVNLTLRADGTLTWGVEPDANGYVVVKGELTPPTRGAGRRIAPKWQQTESLAVNPGSPPVIFSIDENDLWTFFIDKSLAPGSHGAASLL
jgi:hypothetical protein